jgi:ABC-type polysaccharide/polyol phosphate transport system ATPase subunit
MTNPAIQLDRVSKRYVKLDEPALLLKSVLPFSRPHRSELLALRDIDLRVDSGETLGVLGRNGAGKSTLLRLLAGVTRPSEGRMRVVGRIAPLISIGVGFDPEMSGRENVLVNGMLLGMSRSEIRSRFDEIVAFAEIAEFIDTPVKFYSSGMFMRLGFSVAVHARPDVLLVDEVLAVGDLAFQAKCFDRMRELQAEGTTIVIVSHSVTAIQLLCPRAIVLRRGQLAFDGGPSEAVAKHYELLSEQAAGNSAIGPVDGTGGCELVSTSLVAADGTETTVLDQHHRYTLRLRVRCERPIDSPRATFTVVTPNGTVAYQMLPTFGTAYRAFDAGQEVEVTIDWTCALAGGTYMLQLNLTDRDGRETHYHDPTGMMVYVQPRLGSVGIAELDAVTSVDGVVISDHSPVALSPVDTVRDEIR